MDVLYNNYEGVVAKPVQQPSQMSMEDSKGGGEEQTTTSTALLNDF
jgi:hypothetical protein